MLDSYTRTELTTFNQNIRATLFMNAHGKTPGTPYQLTV